MSNKNVMMLLKNIVKVVCAVSVVTFMFLVLADIKEENNMLCYLQALQGKSIPDDFVDVLSNVYRAEVEGNVIHRTRLFGKIIRTVGFSSSVLICFDKNNGRCSFNVCVYLPRFKVCKL